MPQGSDNQLVYNKDYKAFLYLFKEKGMWATYDFSLYYASAPCATKKNYEGKKYISISFTEEIKTIDKFCSDEHRKHYVEIGQLYKLSDDTIVMITNITSYNINYCDQEVTSGYVAPHNFIYVESHIMKQENTKKYFVFSKPHMNGFHSLNFATLIS